MKHELSYGGAKAFAIAGGLLFALLLLIPFSATAQNLTDADVEKISAGPQPIKFSHLIHATENMIPCQYCHIYARRSQVSGVPPVAICAGCHKFVGQQLAEVKKVMTYWEKQEPIPWVKIHDVPDFVRYPHARHVNARNEVFPEGIPCQRCHGEIEKMHVVEKVDSAFGQKGWCLECHLTLPGTLERKRAIPAEEGSSKLLNAMRPDGRHRPNLTDCMTCHK